MSVVIARRSLLAAAAVAVLAACSHPETVTDRPPAATVRLPPANATFDYQIGAVYPPPQGVTVVSRDRLARPAAGIYTICYVNAFQVQPREVTWWQRNHDDLLLRDSHGKYIVDGDWNEILLDTSTASNRSALAAIVGAWIDGCARAGFKAIEPDNLDSYDRSDNILTREDAVAYVRLLASRSHADGLPIGQKNTSELGTDGKAAGLDFAITEECGRYAECGDYTSVYGNHVIDIEYTDSAFADACHAVGKSISVVRRDLQVTAPGSPSYVYDAC